jgi:hypothetical protein
MKKLSLLVGACVLGLWGCAGADAARLTSPGSVNDTDLARMARVGAPTVYNGEPTGGPGYTVITGDGRIWTPEQAPGNTTTTTRSDLRRNIAAQYPQSEVIDEGPTDGSARQ